MSKRKRVEKDNGPSKYQKVEESATKQDPSSSKLSPKAAASRPQEEKKKQQAKKEAKLLAELNSVIAVLQNGALKLGAKTGTSGKIFGSVTSVQVAKAIKEQKGYEIDRRRITIIDDVKELGTYKAKIDFGNGTETEVEFEVVAE